MLIRSLRWMFKIQLIGYLLKEGFVDKINENLVKNEDASKHVIEKIEVDDEKTDIEIYKEVFEDTLNA
jgi:formate dehydrogenase assembly factor FdhD